MELDLKDTTTINEEGARALYAACLDAFNLISGLSVTQLAELSKANGGVLSIVNTTDKLLAAMQLARIGQRRAPRVLIEQICGVVDYRKEPGVNVCFVDYDAGKSVPEAFADMTAERNRATV